MQTVKIPMRELMKVIRLQLEAGGRANLAVTGCSMLPIFRQDRDTVILAPITGRLKPGDVALFRRENESYVLHRVITITPEGYQFCGDNEAQLEQVSHGQLEAIVVGYIRNGKEYTGNRPDHRLYCWSKVRLFGLRKYYIALRRRLGNLRRRLFDRRK